MLLDYSKFFEIVIDGYHNFVDGRLDLWRKKFANVIYDVVTRHRNDDTYLAGAVNSLIDRKQYIVNVDQFVDDTIIIVVLNRHDNEKLATITVKINVPSKLEIFNKLAEIEAVIRLYGDNDGGNLISRARAKLISG